ncbi:hypothetical protein G6O67_003620 [Ophiocordyceps sinensis]|uniref:Uncharacterized protein n=2 Tax=Ophiocordyceps sinensis TaxID=72228 RepID=A0A8H4PSB0_9HYPO|nr:hypothetical protein OCS_04604 [Ophiocordyceps sinensis CO18]KAF4509446.1 hypothetical protein G6O67_003620 [Ophiocordyceps sinensis]
MSIKYYFHKRNVPNSVDRRNKLIALAYQAARDLKLNPQAVLIRSDAHDTTIINGIRGRDPKGMHVTLCYKNQDQLDKHRHVACHAYVDDKVNLGFKEATLAKEKPDSTPKHKKTAPVWPGMDDLWVAPEIEYGDLPDEERRGINSGRGTLPCVKLVGGQDAKVGGQVKGGGQVKAGGQVKVGGQDVKVGGQDVNFVSTTGAKSRRSRRSRGRARSRGSQGGAG